MRVTSEQVHASWSQLVVLIALSLLMQFAWEVSRVGLAGQFMLSGLPGALFYVPVLLFAAWALSSLASQPQQTLFLAITFNAILFVIDASYSVVYFVADKAAFSALGHYWRYYSFFIAVAWFAFVAGLAAIRLLPITQSRRLAALLLAAALLWIPLSRVPLNQTVWAKPYDEQAAAEKRRRLEALGGEDVFYLQPKLLERELASLKPGRKGKVELYFVGVAGDAEQDVFMKEVQYVDRLFKKRFNTEGRSVMLINNPQTATESPIASGTSLQLVLNHIGKTMNADEDILFLFLTSHGSQDHKFALEFWPINFRNIDPGRLRVMLDQSGIKRRVIVVSSCYSGAYVDALKNEDTLVITASAPDKTSFGCSNEAEFTYFGKAYFDEALNKTDSFINAFELAKPVIAAREKKEDFTASDPRIFIGEKIRGPLEALAQSIR